MTPTAATIAALEIELRACMREIGLPSSKAHLRRWQRRQAEIEAEIAKVKASLPASHLEAVDAAGFDVLSWQPDAVEVICRDGTIRSEYLPEDLVHWASRRFIRWRTDGAYAFAGWEPRTDRHSGGRYRHVQHALFWFVWLDREDGSALGRRAS